MADLAGPGASRLGCGLRSAVGALAAARRFSHESGALSAQIKTKPSARHARGGLAARAHSSVFAPPAFPRCLWFSVFLRRDLAPHGISRRVLQVFRYA